MLERFSPTTRNVLLAFLGVVAVWGAWEVRSVLNPIIAGYFAAYVVHPLVLQLQARGWSRRKSVNLIFLSFALGLTVLLAGLLLQGRMLAEDVRDERVIGRAEEQVDAFLERHQGTIDRVRGFLFSERDGEDAADDGQAAAAELGDESADHRGAAEDDELTLRSLAAWVGGELFGEQRAGQAAEVGLAAGTTGLALFRRLFGSALAFGTFCLLLPIYTYFLLFELERIHRFVQQYLPRRERARLVRVSGQIGEVLANFFRGRLLVCLIKGLLLSTGLALLGVDYALLLGLCGGFMALIPFVGPLVAGVAAFFLALLGHDLVGALWRVLAVFCIAELVEGYVLIPKILGDSLGLHPVVVLAAVFVGGAALGMLGFLLALPIAATAIILVRELVLPALEDLAEET
ncbi:MAG: AI-2E family transporter [Planctomycetota bacterium]|jgi:predicted PurR-regulated permease PerM|nr:AI-2E family transporter [Planctomycetota bacterium]MDP6762856.1 AI-2E family transporter [Planctomycetota bacterium]MDP6988734.1 AI-2E family transporter [Planctomycetota bacterium]